MNSPSLSSLLARWEEAYENGQDVPAEELCPDRPDLAAELQKAIDAIRRVRVLRDSPVTPTPLRPVGTEGPALTGSLRSDGNATASNISRASHGRTEVWATGQWLSGEVRIPGFEVLGELGRGGMGMVFKARQVSLVCRQSSIDR